jgi:predicted amino acid-binding ACT domain protein
MSRDRVGIISEVSQALAEIEGDIADIRQTVLRGYFSMILFATFPEGVSAEVIRQQLTKVSQASDFPLEFNCAAPAPPPATTPSTRQLRADRQWQGPDWLCGRRLFLLRGPQS